MIKEIYEDIKKFLLNYMLYSFTKRDLEGRRYIVWVVSLALFLQGISGVFVPASNKFASLFGMNYTFGMFILAVFNAVIIILSLETIERLVSFIKKKRNS